MGKRVFIFLSFVFMSTTLWATTFYVSASNGSDSNSGTSRSSAFKTISKAEDIMNSGDKCIVLAGTYNERVWINTSGTASNPIIYQAEGTVITKGFTIYADYIHIIGFEVKNTPDDWRDGVGIFVEGSYCEIRNNYIHHTARQGIRVFAQNPDSPNVHNCLVKGNRIYKASLSGIGILGRNHRVEDNDISRTLQNSTSDADGIRFQGSGHVIKRNYIHDIRMSDPENVDPHIDCFQTWGPAYNIIIEQNYCENMNDRMQGFMIEEVNAPVKNITVRNNVILAFRFLNVWECENIVIVNNTFKSELSYTGPSGYGIELHDCPNSTVVNNLMIDVGQHRHRYIAIDGTSSQGLEIGYNCIYMSDGGSPKGTPYSNDLWQVNPKVVDINGHDFHLQSGSPLINAGTSVSGIKRDFDGKTRPVGNALDIGAFGYQGSTAPQAPQNVQAIFIYD